MCTGHLGEPMQSSDQSSHEGFSGCGDFSVCLWSSLCGLNLQARQTASKQTVTFSCIFGSGSHSGQPGSRAPIWKKEVVCFADGIDLNFWGLLVRKKKRKTKKRGAKERKRRGRLELRNTRGKASHTTTPQTQKRI